MLKNAHKMWRLETRNYFIIQCQTKTNQSHESR